MRADQDITSGYDGEHLAANLKVTPQSLTVVLATRYDTHRHDVTDTSDGWKPVNSNTRVSIQVCKPLRLYTSMQRKV